jgi:hypothetical protein
VQQVGKRKCSFTLKTDIQAITDDVVADDD